MRSQYLHDRSRPSLKEMDIPLKVVGLPGALETKTKA